MREAEVWWPTDPAALAEVQARVAASDPPPAWEPSGRDTVGAAACCFAPDPDRGGRSHSGDRQEAGDHGWAGACRVPKAGHGDVEVAVVAGRAATSYVPGRLASREGPLLEAALRRLSRLPDVVLVHAAGRDHPLRAGLALHLGAALGVPTVGITDRPLVAEGAPPSDAAGARAPLFVDGELVAWWVRTRPSAHPVVAHAGWRTTPDVAAALVAATVRGARTPEPLRMARRAARDARSTWLRTRP